jgi:hypothetical protein
MSGKKDNKENVAKEINDPNADLNGKALGSESEEEYNETGFAGTTNSVSKKQHQDDATLAIEDTMIGYDGDDSQLDMDIRSEDDVLNTDRGVDDND